MRKLAYKCAYKILKYCLKNDISVNYYSYNEKIFNLALKGLGIGNWDEEDILSGEKFFIESLDIDAPIVFDVGAYTGGYAEKINTNFSNPNIFSFEPQPFNYEQISNKFKSFDNIKLLNIAVGEEKGKIYLFDSKKGGDSQLASCFKNVIEVNYAQESTKYEVDLDTIDNIFEINNLNHIDILKIDTEGNELNVLKGAQKLIENNKINIIQFEFNNMNVVSRTFFRDFVELLSNYDFYRMLPDGLVKLNYDYQYPVSQEIFYFQNIIAINKNYNNKSLNKIICAE